MSVHWFMFLESREKLPCYIKALSASIVYLMSCALDFIWKHQIRRQAVLLPRLSAAVPHAGSVCGYWASTRQLLLDSLRSVRLQREETASTLKNPEKLQLLTHVLTSTLRNQLFSFKKSLLLNYSRCSAWLFSSMKPCSVWDLAFSENILSYLFSYGVELE